MNTLSIRIKLNYKPDIRPLIDILKNQGIENPVYIIELDQYFLVEFDSCEEYWEIQDQLTDQFDDFEFREDVENGELVRMIIYRIPKNIGYPEDSHANKLLPAVMHFAPKREQAVTIPPNTKLRVLIHGLEKEYDIPINRPAKPAVIAEEFWNGYRKISAGIEAEYKRGKTGWQSR